MPSSIHPYSTWWVKGGIEPYETESCIFHTFPSRFRLLLHNFPPLSNKFFLGAFVVLIFFCRSFPSPRSFNIITRGLGLQGRCATRVPFPFCHASRVVTWANLRTGGVSYCSPGDLLQVMAGGNGLLGLAIYVRCGVRGTFIYS